MTRTVETVEARSNLDITVRERGKIVRRESGHNIVVNTGRQFLAEVIGASAFSGASFTRTQNTLIRYIGFGVGGSRQFSSSAGTAPISTDYPGTNIQTDVDLTVSRLERPVRVDGGPTWMKEVVTPASFPSTTSVKFTAIFDDADISYGGYTSVPISEIGLYLSSADPSLPNGTAGAYPGAGGVLFAYDTFNNISKTAIFSIEVSWEIRF